MDTALFKLADDSYALRIWTKPPAPTAEERRLPTHFILVLDTSDSMSDGNKLANVKHSASLVLHFLGNQDWLSIITFGDDATIHAKSVRCDPEQKQVLADALSRIQTDGCTNLSAGLVRVREILAARSPEVAAVKTGVLLLTDGHANRGVFGADPLRSVVRQLNESFPGVSLQVVGYGTDHNAELLKSFADVTQGTYSIVDDREGAATTIGDSLGNLFSCVAQQVSIAPAGLLEVEGTQFITSGNPPRVQIGDLYEGNETLVLFKLKEGATEGAGLMRVGGTLLPSLEPFQATHAFDEACETIGPELDLSIKLTRARYTVSRLFRELRDYRLGSSRFATIKADLEATEAALSALGHDVNPTVRMLKTECVSIRNAMQTLLTGTRGEAADIAVRTIAHEAYTNLGRGTVAALAPRRRFPRSNAVSPPTSDDETEDPVAMQRRAPPDLNASQYLTSPTASRMTNRVTRLMATMSVGGEEAAAAAHEAATLSQVPAAAAPEPSSS